MEKKIIVNTYSNEIYSKTEVILNYTNSKDNPIELIIEIPIRTQLIFESFTAKIKDRIIKSKIMDKEKAEEKYNDAIAQGNTGLTTSYKLDEKLYEVKIGNLPAKESLELKCYFIQFISLKNGLYYLNIIKDFPKILNYTPNEIQGEVIIETNSEMTEINTGNIKGSFLDENKKKYKINYKNEDIEKILFKTKNMKLPLLMSQYNPSTNETNYILNTFIEQDPKFKENKYPCLFILIIDQSGSMSSSMNEVTKTLSNLIDYFPQESYYQLIGFGSNYKKYDSQPKINTKENIIASKKIINSLDADMGGTDLSKPLNNILKEYYMDYQNISLSKQIIILTDGDINLGEDIIELIKLHNNEFKIHLIGMGHYINEETIINTSKVGNGSYHIINDASDLNKELLDIINECTKDYINNYTFTLNDKYFYELQSINKTTYSNESMNYCFIKENNNDNNEINIKFNWENFKEKFEKQYLFKKGDIIRLPDGEDLSKLIIGLSFKYDIIKNEKEQINFSKKYQVLSKLTTLFADIVNENSIINKMETVKQASNIPNISNIKEGNWSCFCGKSYLSNAALQNHIKTKHPEILEGHEKKGRGRPRLEGHEKKGRGRPRKYLPQSNTKDKYDTYFDSELRKEEEGKIIDNKHLVQEVYKFIYESKYSDKLFSKPKNYKDDKILNDLFFEKKLDNKSKNEKTEEAIFYEYLMEFKDKTNEKYFSFMIKFIILLKEFYFLHTYSKVDNNKPEENKSFLLKNLPDYCNEFYGEFLSKNDFFEINENGEIIEIIIHFFTWLFKNEYTKSKLSLNN